MAFCAAIATAVILGACGSGMPGNAVVQIGQATISSAALDHWLAVANDSSQTQTGTKAPALPLPPDYTACIRPQREGGREHRGEPVEGGGRHRQGDLRGRTTRRS